MTAVIVVPALIAAATVAADCLTCGTQRCIVADIITAKQPPPEVAEDDQGPGLATVVILASHRRYAGHHRVAESVEGSVTPISPAQRLINDARRRWAIS